RARAPASSRRTPAPATPSVRAPPPTTTSRATRGGPSGSRSSATALDQTRFLHTRVKRDFSTDHGRWLRRARDRDPRLGARPGGSGPRPELGSTARGSPARGRDVGGRAALRSDPPPNPLRRAGGGA